MRMNNLNLKLILVFVVSGFLFTGCEESNSVDDMETIAAISEEETIAFVESEDISDEIDNIVDDYLYGDLSVSSKDEAAKSDGQGFRGMPECAVRTVTIEGATKIVTLDFGESCQLPNGHVLAGKIIMSYVYNADSKTVSVIHSFEGFSFNDVMVEGENTIVRTRENENGNPQSSKTMNVTITWPDGEFISRVGTKVREWIEGSESGTWGDNVYLITGNWTNTFKNGTVCSVTITEALRREMACRFIVSGIKEIVKGDVSGILNFGDGTCDNIAVFTNSEGVEKEITLRKRRRI